MDINDLDFSFNKKYYRTHEGDVLISGDLISSIGISEFEKKDWILHNDVKSLPYCFNIKIVEYFNINRSGIFPFFHEPFGNGFNMWNFTSFHIGCLSSEHKYSHKISIEDLERLKLSLTCDNEDILYPITGKENFNPEKKNGSYIINFKDTIYYKNILKTLRGIRHRNVWVKKYHEFPYLYAIANSNDHKNLFKYDKEKDRILLSLNDFYKISTLQDPNRNLEIYCKIKPKSKHKEHFFRFKKETKKCEEYCLQAEQVQDCIL